MNAKRIAFTVLLSLPPLMVVFSGVMKLIGGAEVDKALTDAGVDQYRLLLGLMEISFAALFLYPKTMKIGFLLLTCYFAGALATDLSHAGRPLFGPTFILVLIWIVAFVRDRLIFLPASGAKTA